MFAIDPRKGYFSPQGWNLSLPSGWKVLPKDPNERSCGLENIEVFAHPQDPSLSMTWMRSNRDIGQRLWQQFFQLTRQNGAAPRDEVQELMTYIFRLIGKVESANVVSLPDGQRALEILEIIKSFSGGAEPMQGYHLVLPVRGAGSGMLLMQQLSFYARAGKFSREIAAVIGSARSFRYF